MGSIIITHSERSGSVFLQFEADKDLVLDMLRKSERHDLEAGWRIEVKDTEPRASILQELWEAAAQQERKSHPQTAPARLIGATSKEPPGEHLEFHADSVEQVAQTVNGTGYRPQLDRFFREAIARVGGLRRIAEGLREVS
jgi:hypothetical protein